MNKCFYLIIGLFFLDCDSKLDYIELEMPKKNPTRYEFNASIASIKCIIKENHNKMPLSNIESADDSSFVWSEQILRNPGNKNDFYVFDIVPADTHKVYYCKERPIPYSYSFLIHITSINSNKTLVEIRTINPEICIGVKFPHNIIDFDVPEGSLMKRVRPSTIEEYQVLLVIGEALGVKEEMPRLIMPIYPPK
jgi:hypothetical protein